MNFDNLLKKLKENTLSEKEAAYLLAYLKNHEPGSEMKTLFKKAWDESSDINKEIDSKRIYNQVLNKINFKITQENTVSASRFTSKYLMPALRYAAVFILAFALYWLVKPGTPRTLAITEQILSSDQFQKVTVPYGSKTKVELPDGSVIILNSGSNLSYSSTEFNSRKRSVFLEGEGFFTVNKDTARPFYVNTHGMKLKVLGTSFNIKAYNDENAEEATLVSGSVEIYAGTDHKETGKPIVLKPNEKVVFNKTGKLIRGKETITGNKSIEPVTLKSLKRQDDSETEVIISWKDNKLIFDNEPFGSLLVKIERWYDVDIIVNYPELYQARFTGTFDKETVEQVMNALSTITPFKYEIKKNQIVLNK